MPTRSAPRLGHRSFNWPSSLGRLRGEIHRRRIEILRIVGFFEEHDLDEHKLPDNLDGLRTIPCSIEQNTMAKPKEVHRKRNEIYRSIGGFRERDLGSEEAPASQDGSRVISHSREWHIMADANEFLSELIGILAKAVAIRFDAGFRAAGEVIATLREIKSNPRLTRTRASHLDPEAIGMLAMSYQRQAEPPGTYWYDVTEIGSRKIDRLNEPSAERIRLAAQRAIASLEAERKRGRPLDVASAFLAHRLAAIFGRYGRKPTRTVDQDIEYGDFHDFVHLLVPILNGRIRVHCTTQVRPFSAATILRATTPSKARPARLNAAASD